MEIEISDTSNTGKPRKLKAVWTQDVEQDLAIMNGARHQAIKRAWIAFCKGDTKKVEQIKREDKTGKWDLDSVTFTLDDYKYQYIGITP